MWVTDFNSFSNNNYINFLLQDYRTDLNKMMEHPCPSDI